MKQPGNPRRFSDPTKRRMYNHYLTTDIVPNTGSSDRARYWKGRLGYPAKAAGVSHDMHTYPAWAAGFDLFKANGLPDHPVHSALGTLQPYLRTSK